MTQYLVERGDTRQFTWQASVSPSQIGVGFYDGTGALVQSVTATASDTTHYYGVLTFANTLATGWYKLRWDAWVSSLQDIKDELIRLVDVTALETGSWYAQQGDVRDAWTAIGASGVDVAAVQIERGIRVAQRQVDAQISRAYTLPFSDTPPLIREIATDLAVYQVARSSTRRDDQGNMPVWLSEMKQEADDTLLALSTGSLTLLTESGTVWPTLIEHSGGLFHSHAGRRPTFTELEPSLQRQDPEAMADEEEDIWS